MVPGGNLRMSIGIPHLDIKLLLLAHRSGKMIILDTLLKSLQKVERCVLIFSQTVAALLQANGPKAGPLHDWMDSKGRRRRLRPRVEIAECCSGLCRCYENNLGSI